MGAETPYLKRGSSGLLWYRRVFPDWLREYVPGKRRQVRRSLGGREYAAPGVVEAFRQAAREYDEIERIARKAAAGVFDLLTPPIIAYLKEVLRHQVLLDDEEGRFDPA